MTCLKTPAQAVCNFAIALGEAGTGVEVNYNLDGVPTRMEVLQEKALDVTSSTPQDFEEVRHFLSEVECINSGGCAIAALAMYRWLEKHDQHHGVKFAYLYSDYNSDAHEQNRKALLDKEIEPDACTHAVIVQDGELKDCNRTYNFQDYNITQVIEDPEFMLRSINTNNWNHMFDRVNVPIIAEALGIDLSDVCCTFND